jgi:predicted PhzF superfamily epimerase YddE/YHI9
LASAHIFYTELNHTKSEVWFESLSGLLKVSKKHQNIYTLDFPANPPEETKEIPEGIFEGLGIDEAPLF